MPTYTFRKKDTNYTQTDFMSISEMEMFLERNPDWDIVPAAPLIHSGTGLQKPDQGFRDILREIKRKHSQGITKSSINTFD